MRLLRHQFDALDIECVIWSMPNVLPAALFGSQAFVSAATIGRQVRALELTVTMSDLAVDTMVDEPSLAALWEHTARWLRTIRSVRPGGYACCFMTFSPPLAALGAALAGFRPMALILLGITVAARLVLHFPRHAREWRRLGLIPLLDALLFT